MELVGLMREVINIGIFVSNPDGKRPYLRYGSGSKDTTTIHLTVTQCAKLWAGWNWLRTVHNRRFLRTWQ
jgi:hypothetical protein